MSRAVYVLRHRTCGHVAGYGTDRARLERCRQTFATAGYHAWRVVLADDATNSTDAHLEAMARDEDCDTCCVDHERARALISAARDA